MKNDIDSLLEAMFRGGRMNFKLTGTGPDGGKKEPPVQPAGEALQSAARNTAQAEKDLEAAEKLNQAMSQSLQQDVERLTREAREDLHSLEARLKQDGLESASSGNAGSPQDLEAAFQKARKEAGERVVGQENFLSALTVAFKRPFVAGAAPHAPLGRTLVLGKEGTGRHTALEVIAASLFRQGVLKSPKLAFIDLADYGAPGTEKLFLQDLYAALKSGACGLVFEHFERCSPAVLSLLSALFQEGEAPLPGRYAEQKGMLVDVGSALVPGAVSALSGEGKYLFLLTDRDKAKVAGTLGTPFLSALDDVCETGPFSPESLRVLSERTLKGLCEKAEKQLQFTFTYEPSAVEALCASFDPQTGAASLEEAASGLFKAMSEAKLKQGLSKLSGTVAGEDGQLLARYGGGEAPGVLRAGRSDGDAAREEALRAVKAELSEIVGLQNVKEYILSLEDHVKVQQLRRERGLKTESPSMHMIFTGNPGTGKTTVARLVSRYLKAIGVLFGGQLVEVTRADLVGRYVGHTAPLTTQAIRSALGGVLFIDEAYSLYRGRDDSFGLEAIDALVKGMEDHRDELIVILAGYSYEMEEFLAANSGLRSRFPNIIEFPDYTPQELLDIAKSIVKSKGYRLDPRCDAPLLACFEKAQREGDPRTNGNGRMARNKVEEAILNGSRRNLKAPESERDLELLLPEDFEW